MEKALGGYIVNPRKKQILKKAIKKALKNGWAEKNFGVFIYLDSEEGIDDYVEEILQGINMFYGLIFDHSFAESIWGKEIFGSDDVPPKVPTYIWQWHLWQMVIEEDPLKYLEKFL